MNAKKLNSFHPDIAGLSQNPIPSISFQYHRFANENLAYIMMKPSSAEVSNHFFPLFQSKTLRIQVSPLEASSIENSSIEASSIENSSIENSSIENSSVENSSIEASSYFEIDARFHHEADEPTSFPEDFIHKLANLFHFPNTPKNLVFICDAPLTDSAIFTEWFNALIRPLTDHLNAFSTWVALDSVSPELKKPIPSPTLEPSIHAIKNEAFSSWNDTMYAAFTPIKSFIQAQFNLTIHPIYHHESHIRLNLPTHFEKSPNHKNQPPHTEPFIPFFSNSRIPHPTTNVFSKHDRSPNTNSPLFTEAVKSLNAGAKIGGDIGSSFAKPLEPFGRFVGGGIGTVYGISKQLFQKKA